MMSQLSQTDRVSLAYGSGAHGKDFPELDPKLRQAVMDNFNGNEGYFPRYLGFRLTDVRRGYARLEVRNDRRLCQPVGVMHGGASFGLADTAVAFALIALYGPGQVTLTIEMKINYLEPIPENEEVVAEAFVLRASKSSAYAEVDIWCGGRLAGRASTTYMIRPQRPTA